MGVAQVLFAMHGRAAGFTAGRVHLGSGRLREPGTRRLALPVAKPAVVGTQRNPHAVARQVVGWRAVVQPAVVSDQGAQRPGRVVGLLGRQVGALRGNPACGGGHELRQTLGAYMRDGVRPPGALLVHLGREHSHGRIKAPGSMSGAHQQRAVLLRGLRHLCMGHGRRQRSQRAQRNQQHSQGKVLDGLAHHSPAAVPSTTQPTTTARRSCAAQKAAM